MAGTFADVVSEAVLTSRLSSTSITSNDEEPKDGREHRFGSVASLNSRSKFKLAAQKSMLLKRQNKLHLADHLHKFTKGLNLLAPKTVRPVVEEVVDQAAMKDTSYTGVVSQDAPFQDPKFEEFEKAFQIALRTHYDMQFFQTTEENEESLQYIREVFKIIPQDRYDLVLKTAKEAADAAREVAVKITIIKGNGLPAMDANGKSDPYCKMGILHKHHIDTKRVHKGNLDDWAEEKLVLGSVLKSTIKPMTLDPVWEETFELKLTNPQEEYLVIEVWDSDDEQRRKLKSFKGFHHLLRDLRNEDDFLGRTFFLLKHVPVKGSDKVLELHSHSGKHRKGTLTVNLDIVGKREEQVSEEELLVNHLQLLNIFVAFESEKGGSQHMRWWDGCMTEPGSRLLIQHAALHRLSNLQAAALNLSVFMNYHKTHAMRMSALRVLIAEIRKHETELSDIERSLQGTPQIPFRDHTKGIPTWMFQLLRDLNELQSDILNIMKMHLDIFNIKSDAGIDRLKAHVLTLKDIYDTKLFTGELSSEERNFEQSLVSAIQVAVPSWFLVLVANLMPPHSSNEDKMQAFKALCTHILKQCDRLYDKVQHVFLDVGVDYFSAFFYSLDKLLHSEAENQLDSCTTDECILMAYEVYMLLNDIAPFAKRVDKKFLETHGVTHLSIESYSEWFRGYVSEWIRIATYKAKERIWNAMTLDTVVKYTDKASFSSSAVDTHATFLQVISFWRDLKWPDREQSLGFFITIIQNLCEMATYYGEIVFMKIHAEDYTDDQGKFTVTDKLCVAINNMFHVRQVLENIGEELDLEAYFKWLDEGTSKEEGNLLSERAKKLMDSVLQSCDEDMMNKVDTIMTQVKEKLAPTVLEFFPKIMEAAPDIPSDEVIDPLLQYISSNMGKLGQALLTPVFLSILYDIWKDTIHHLKLQYDKIPHKPTTRQQHARLREIALTLEMFFEAGGNGLTKTQMETDEYKSLIEGLNLANMTTEQLTRVFLQDLAKQQVEANDEFGILRFSHLYVEKEKKLQINVVSARGIPGLDKSGKSDPYVEIHLLPIELFLSAAEKHYKTDTKKQTLEPFFNNQFSIPVEEQNLKEDGAVILLAMFDHDKIGSDDFAGLCVVPTNSTPIGTELKMEHQHIFHYKHTPSYVELEKRIAEKIASDFLKMMKKFVFEGDVPHGHPIKKLRLFSKS